MTYTNEKTDNKIVVEFRSELQPYLQFGLLVKTKQQAESDILQ